MPDIQWYPGHMAKTRRMLVEQMRAIDAVIELCDARAPQATRNPDLDGLCGGKQRLLILNKADLAEERVTQAWVAWYQARGMTVMKYRSTGDKAQKALSEIERLCQPSVERMLARGVRKTLRLMVIGIPNVGKSTFINRMHGMSVAKTSDRPGVTRAKQWVKVGPYLELMDTPGMLWPRLENQGAAQKLAWLGSIRDVIMDGEELAISLLRFLHARHPEELMARFKLTPEDCLLEEDMALLEAVCRRRGWLLSGGRMDTERGAALILDEFRAGRVGRVSLQRPEEE